MYLLIEESTKESSPFIGKTATEDLTLTVCVCGVMLLM